MNYYKYDLLRPAHDSCYCCYSYDAAVIVADCGNVVAAVAAVHDFDAAPDASPLELCYYADYSDHHRRRHHYCCATEPDEAECGTDYCPIAAAAAVDNAAAADDGCCSVIVAAAAAAGAGVESAAAADSGRDVAGCSQPFETDELG